MNKIHRNFQLILKLDIWWLQKTGPFRVHLF